MSFSAAAVLAVFTATALSPGDATIAASANGTSKASVVHVAPQPASIVSLLPSPLPLQQGATGSLRAGTISAQIPVVAVSPGSTRVAASLNGTSASASVEVTPPPVVTAVTPATLSLPKLPQLDAPRKMVKEAPRDEEMKPQGDDKKPKPSAGEAAHGGMPMKMK